MTGDGIAELLGRLERIGAELGKEKVRALIATVRDHWETKER